MGGVVTPRPLAGRRAPTTPSFRCQFAFIENGWVLKLERAYNRRSFRPCYGSPRKKYKPMDIFAPCFAYNEPGLVKAAGIYPYFHTLSASEGPVVTIEGRRVVMLGSNNYLSLTHHPDVLRAAHDAIDRYGTSCTGSRFLNGNLDLHEALEGELAAFTGKQAALIFSSGFLANLGAVGLLGTGSDVTLFLQDSSRAWPVEAESVDVIFTSNFFEHLPTRETLEKTVAHAFAALKPGGKLIAMGPNIRLLPGEYWDFWDHHLPLSERSLGELLTNTGFTMQLSHPRFLPYSMVDAPRYPTAFLSWYLRLPFFWRFFGRQFLLAATKPGSRQSTP